MITIPTRLEKILKDDKALHSRVEESVANFELILKWSKLPFFPEYTEHGEEHITHVLRTADALIREDSWGLISPNDAACLILSTLLHDSGMHLSEHGFVHLISGSTSKIVNSRIDSKPWFHIWEEFLSEARRFDGKTLMALFGTADPIRIPPADWEDFTLKDKRLIGEFVRRLHPRLAHEIALVGMPNAPDIGLSPSIPSDIRDISGLIARSHGAPLRTFFPYIENLYHLQEYQEIHIVFLMCVLRIADYLQVHSERAPQQYLKLARLRSPISQQEWRNHSVITNITTQDKDPEAVLIQAKPNDVRTYLRLRALLRSLQEELDISWAVLGEVYGLRQRLKGLGLEIRRVKSNLDDEKSFEESSHFVPYKASFESAGADLLKLLAEPLYGDDPTYGIRELIQNSVDACLELRDLPESVRKTRQADRPDVVVSLTRDEGGNRILTVDDQGIGMTVDTLRNYFLRAGASYRQSIEWKKVHEDDSGHSRVLRSGRFGIGVLAAFILGDEIHVATRHARESQGIEFTARLETDPIELKHVNRRLGTTISVILHPHIAVKVSHLLSLVHASYQSSFGSLPNGLYLLETPSLGICLDETTFALDRRWPALGLSKLPLGWHRLKTDDFPEIHWTFREFGNLACNGIAVAEPASTKNIPGRYKTPKWFEDLTALELESPSVSVFDPDGKLPLKLTRTELASTPIAFNRKLVEEICRDICAFMLVEPWQGKFVNSTIPSDPPPCTYRGLGRRGTSYFCVEEGFTLPVPEIIRALDISRVVVVGLINRGLRTPRFEGAGTGIMIEAGSNFGLKDIDKWGKEQLSMPGKFTAPWGRIDGVRIYAHEDYWDRWRTKLGRTTVANTRVEEVHREWIELEAGDCGQRATTLEEIADWARLENKSELASIKPAFAEYHLNTQKDKFDQGTLFGEMMAATLGTITVPYSLSRRKKLLPRSFVALHDYITSHVEAATEARKREKAR